jgi:hypothetical protein
MKFGYTHEKNHAFFPGYPMLLNLLYRFLDYGWLILGYEATGKDPVPITTTFWITVVSTQATITAANVLLLYKNGKKLLSLPFFD